MENEKEANNKNYQRSKTKKHSFQDKTNVTFGLKKNYDDSVKIQKTRYYSTKLLRNFVPQIRPKQSVCKPTFFKLNENENDTKSNEDEKSELDKISSCSEVEEESKNSSSLSSSDEKDKEEEINSESDFSLEEKNTTNREYKAYEEDDNEEYTDLTYKKNTKNTKKDNKGKNGLKDIRKEMSKIKTKSIERKSKEMEETINSNLKETFDLDSNYIKKNLNIEKNSKISNDINAKLNKLKLSCSNFSTFSILDILSIKNEKN